MTLEEATRRNLTLQGYGRAVRWVRESTMPFATPIRQQKSKVERPS